MLNVIWSVMLLAGIAYAAATGGLSSVTGVVLEACKSAVALAVAMAGAVAFWAGIMKIAERSGLTEGLTAALKAPLRLLFPNIPQNHAANRYIAANFIANILGLGWAATPAGLSAMRELSSLSRRTGGGSGRASDEMCLFMVINISSLQLISINLLAYRESFGSKNPAEIIGPGIFVTLLTTVIGIVMCKIMEAFGRK